MPKMSSNRGAVELPLTYVYAVLIGIVVFIIAARVIGVQGESASAQNEEIILRYLDSVIDGFAADPNVIQNLSLGRMSLELDWTDTGRIIVGSREERLRTPTFSERELSGDSLTAWTYPYGIVGSSVPMLYLSDGSKQYRIVNSTSLYGEVPVRADLYGLILTYDPAAPLSGDNTRDLCIGDQSSTFNACDLRFVTTDMPFGYLSWSGGTNWYPVYSEGALFAALFSASEQTWVAGMEEVYARDNITRAVLSARAETLRTGTAEPVCETAYATTVSAFDAIEAAVTFEPTSGAATTLDTDFTDITDQIAALENADLVLIRNDCPEVVG